MEKKTDNIIRDVLMLSTAILLIILGIVLWKQNKTINEYQNIINSIDTTSVVIKHDTIDVSTDTTIYKPVIIKETIIRVDTLYNDDGEAINVKKKEKTYSDTIIQNTDTIRYNAYISGYDINDSGYPQLDSINVHTSHKNIHTIEYVTRTIKTPQKQNKWGITIGVGTGYGIYNKQPDIYIGVTLGYKIF